MQMYAHPKRHLPQTETTDKNKQTNMQKNTHTSTTYPSPVAMANAERAAAKATSNE